MAKPAHFKHSKLPPEELAVAGRLAEAREHERFTLSELSAQAEIGLSALKHYERGGAPLLFEAGNRICERLNLNQYWLAFGESPVAPFVPVKSLAASALAVRSARRLSFYEAYIGAFKHRLDTWIKEHPELLNRRQESSGEMIKRLSIAKLEAMLNSVVAGMRRRASIEDKATSLRLVFRLAEELRERFSRERVVDDPIPLGQLSAVQIGAKLKATRKKLHLSQVQAAQKWEVPVSTLRKWEQGKRNPRGLALKQLEQILSAPGS